MLQHLPYKAQDRLMILSSLKIEQLGFTFFGVILTRMKIFTLKSILILAVYMTIWFAVEILTNL